MISFRTIALLASLALLAGCQTKPTVETEYVYKAIPSALKLTCEPVAPPNSVAYKAAKPEEREEQLVEMIKRQNVVIAQCQSQNNTLWSWDAQQAKNFSPQKEAP